MAGPNAPFAERVDEASSSTIAPWGRVDIPLINNAGLLTNKSVAATLL